MRFEIEDAGGGCCLGPEVVVVRAEDGRGSIQCIPPQQGQRRQEVARRLALRGCDRLGVRPGDEVLVCRGDLFELAVPELGERGFVVERGPVSEETHRMAEDEHRRQLAAILGYEPRIRDRRYAALNLLLLAEARRRPALRRFWKANVRRPADMDPQPEASAPAATQGAAETGAPTEAPHRRRRRGGRGRSRSGGDSAGTAGAQTGADAGTEAGAGRGTEAGTQAGTEAGAERGTGTGTQAGTEAGAEPGTGTGKQAGTDAGAERGTEAGTQAGAERDAERGREAGTQAATEAGAERGTSARPSGRGRASGTAGAPPRDTAGGREAAAAPGHPGAGGPPVGLRSPADPS